jgi:hypothetical protein
VRRLAVLCLLVGVICVLGASAAAARPSESATAAQPKFSGNGGKSLPPFRVTRPSTLRWKNSGAIFQIFPKGLGSGGSVNAASRSGATYLKPGSYRLDVNAIGSWSIHVVPGIERPRPLGNGLVGFRGNGGRTLPPFSTRRGANLVWTNSGAIFQIFADDFSDVSVNSQAKRGTSYMDAGRHALTVNAIGAWTIAWKP